MGSKKRYIEITQRRSLIGQSARQKATMHALGLRRRHQCIKKEWSASVAGMVAKVAHLISYKEL